MLLCVCLCVLEMVDDTPNPFLSSLETKTCLFSIVQYPADFWIPSSIYQPQPKKSRRTKWFFLSLKMKHAKKTLTVSSIILFLCIYLLFSTSFQSWATYFNYQHATYFERWGQYTLFGLIGVSSLWLETNNVPIGYIKIWIPRQAKFILDLSPFTNTLVKIPWIHLMF